MKEKVMNLASKIKKFFVANTKMKLLVLYLVANLIYITLGSYIFMTKQINANFNYQKFSLGLRNILILNVFIFLVICFEKHYKKNWAHLWIVLVAIFRLCFNVVCF